MSVWGTKLEKCGATGAGGIGYLGQLKRQHRTEPMLSFKMSLCFTMSITCPKVVYNLPSSCSSLPYIVPRFAFSSWVRQASE